MKETMAFHYILRRKSLTLKTSPRPWLDLNSCKQLVALKSITLLATSFQGQDELP